MSDNDIKELVKRLRKPWGGKILLPWMTAYQSMAADAADAIEALRAENERLKAALELVQFNGWQLSTQRQQQHWEVSKPCTQKASETTSVCVWTLANLTDETGWYKKGCDSETYERRWDGHLACPSCGKPIEFTEAE